MASFFDKLGGTKIEEKPVSARPAGAVKKIKVQKEDLKPEEPAESEEETSEPTMEDDGQLAIDVYQTDSAMVIKSAIAGTKPEDLDIEITNDMVTIKGKREKEEEIKQDDYYYQECYWGSFSRSVVLPVEVDADRAEASFKNGILTLRLPKFERTKSKKLKVKSGD